MRHTAVDLPELRESLEELIVHKTHADKDVPNTEEWTRILLHAKWKVARTLLVMYTSGLLKTDERTLTVTSITCYSAHYDRCYLPTDELQNSG